MRNYTRRARLPTRKRRRGGSSSYSKSLKREIKHLHEKLKKHPNSDPDSAIRRELREKTIKYNAFIKNSPKKRPKSKRAPLPPLLMPRRQKASYGKQNNDSFDTLSPRRERGQVPNYE